MLADCARFPRSRLGEERPCLRSGEREVLSLPPRADRLCPRPTPALRDLLRDRLRFRDPDLCPLVLPLLLLPVRWTLSPAVVVFSEGSGVAEGARRSGAGWGALLLSSALDGRSKLGPRRNMMRNPPPSLSGFLMASRLTDEASALAVGWGASRSSVVDCRSRLSPRRTITRSPPPSTPSTRRECPPSPPPPPSLSPSASSSELLSARHADQAPVSCNTSPAPPLSTFPPAPAVASSPSATLFPLAPQAVPSPLGLLFSSAATVIVPASPAAAPTPLTSLFRLAP